MTKIIATSDLHGYLPDIPECDILLIAGDICPFTDHRPFAQAVWLNTVFRAWLEQAPVKHIVGIAGNHDIIFEDNPEMVPVLPWHYLQDTQIVVEGLQIYGTPWQLRFFDWAFNLDKPELDEAFTLIPPCDILITHSPPYGVGDIAKRHKVNKAEIGPEFEHYGSRKLLEMVAIHQPQLHVFGHLHMGAGTYKIGTTICANVAHLDENYNPTNQPVLFEL